MQFGLRTLLCLGLALLLSGLPSRTSLAQGNPPGRKVALLVGINKYQKPGFSNLGYAERDVEQMAAELRRLGFTVTLLTGSGTGETQATRANIDRAARRLVAPLGKDDVALVMLSGHGLQFETIGPDGTRREDSFYCPVDAVANDPQTLFSLSTLISEILAPNVGRKLVLVDACRDVPRDPGRGAKGIQGRVIALPEDTAVFFSCRAGQRSFENEELEHGVFTWCVLEGLRGKAAHDGEVAWTDLVAHVSRRMATPDIRKYILDQQEPIPAGGVGRTVLGRVSTVNSLGMTLVLIPAGEFLRGSPADEEDRDDDDEGPQRRVRITKPFYLGVHEVTRGQFRKFVEATRYRTEPERDGEGGEGWNELTGTFEEPDPKYTWRNTGFEQADEHPVVNVTRNDAVAFCQWLSRTEGLEYRLPTEAEWEYACRAGTTTRYHHGDDSESLARVGNVADGTAKSKWTNYQEFSYISTRDGYVFTAPVGRFQPNPFGLYDMHGNVREWCADWYGKDYYAKAPQDDPSGPSEGSFRLSRGGSWFDPAWFCRSACRGGHTPSLRSTVLGFRIVRVSDSRLGTAGLEASKAGEERDDNGLKMKFVWCPSGTFTMGSPPDESGRDEDEDQVQVTLTRGFWLGRYEVTQAQWWQVMGSEPWTGKENVKEGADYPAVSMDWDEAMEFCRKLTEQEQQAGRLPADWKYTLPTEAQWEYACRAGTRTRYSFGDDEARLGEYAWFKENAAGVDEKYAHEVGRKQANPWGLHDMHGNADEWCRDWFTDKLPGGQVPEVTEQGSLRVFRGGSWLATARICRPAFRNRCSPSNRYNYLGFRVARVSDSRLEAVGLEGSKAGEERDDNGLKMKLVWCPSGTFTMGSPPDESGRHDHENQVQVTLTRGFWLGKYEVTQAQWRQVMESEPWTGKDFVEEGADYPAVSMDWDEAIEFCRKLTEQERQAGRLPADWEYTLPTEAQWEYACRAGTSTRYSFGDDEARLGEYAWFKDNADGVGEKYAHEVGRKQANPWGLHDMHGNAWEWCRDWFTDKLPGGQDPEVTKPDVTEQSAFRVPRGGGWYHMASLCRSAYRWNSPSSRSSDQGIRVARVPTGQ